MVIDQVAYIVVHLPLYPGDECTVTAHDLMGLAIGKIAWDIDRNTDIDTFVHKIARLMAVKLRDNICSWSSSE